MQSIHPLAVHLPIVLVLIWPLIDAVGLLLGRPDISATGLALLLLAIPCALLATLTGQAAYDAAIAAGQLPAVLDDHKDTAELMPWLLLVLAAIRLLGVKKKGRPIHKLSIALGLILAGVVISVGASGGRLVYQHAVGVRAG